MLTDDSTVVHLTSYLFGIFRLYVFFYNVTATTEIYTLSLHDALPIYAGAQAAGALARALPVAVRRAPLQPAFPVRARAADRKSTRLNSSHLGISYAVFCLKKKKRQDRANAPQYSLEPTNARCPRRRAF